MGRLLTLFLAVFVSTTFCDASQPSCTLPYGDNSAGIYDATIQKCILQLDQFAPKDFFIAEGFGCTAGSVALFFNNMAWCICSPPLMTSSDTHRCARGKMLGEPCNDKNLCDKFSGFTCDGGKCACNGTWEGALCNNPDGCEYRSNSYYDKVSRKCSPRGGTRCTNDSECRNAQWLSQGIFTWQTCKCLPGFTSTSTGCEQRKTIGQQCIEQLGSELCDETVGLKCSRGTCRCSAPSTWEIRNKMCRRPVGASCIQGYGHANKDQLCGSKSYCNSSGTCTCDEGYDAKDGYCYGANKARCTKTSDCGASLVCADSTCVCKYPTSQIYNEAKKLCLGQLGFLCARDEECLGNLTCANSRCDYPACPEGSTLSQAGKCFKTLGATCTSHECNKDEGLACIEETCSCLDHGWEYASGRGCVAKMSNVCGNISVESREACPRHSSTCNHEYKVECKEGECNGGRCI